MFEMKPVSREEFEELYPGVSLLAESYKCNRCFDNRCIIVILNSITRESQTIECVYCKIKK